MTRVAALYDIHGNLPALEAVLSDVRRAGVEEIVVGGDVVPGPMAREVFDCLMSQDIATQFIMGNGDREVLARMRGRDYTAMPDPFESWLGWCASQLTRDHGQVMESWPATTSLEIDDIGEVVFCHATPRNDVEIFTRNTPEARLVPIFEHLYARIVVCGHTHMQFDRIIGATRVVNAGSVGMPFGEPGAYWMLLGGGVEFRRTRYDRDAAAARIRETTYPGADVFAETYVLHPPSEQAILETYAKAELTS